MKIRNLPWPIFTLLVASATAVRMEAGTFAEVNWALTGTASQSSDLDTEHIASLAIDGNTDGDWSHGSVTHTANTDDPPVWEVDLGQTNLIGEVRVWFRTDCCQSRNDDFTLYVLDANHAKVLSRKYPGRPPGNVAYNFAPAVVGRYVRIEGQTPRTTSDGYLALAEVQVFNPFQIESIRITQGPTNVAAIANATATFGPVIADAPGVAPGKLTFQWRKNGEDIPGAIGASYTTPPLSPADNGAQYTIQAMLPGVSASATATLTVTAAPPVLTIQHTGNTIQISWPVSATGFVLQSTESLSSPAWAQPAESVSIQGDQNTVTITDPDNTRFYRLKL